jgi:4-aminobutyrate aminotransferase
MPIQGVTHIPYPYTYRPTLAAQPDEEDYGETVVNYLKKTVFKSLVAPEDVAAIVVEPIQGEGGYVVPPASFFPMLREVCDEYGILLIVDEVQTGVGRTGRWWAIEHWGVEPDIVCAAKGIASGIPLGGIIARKSISTWPVSAHGNTYGGNPIACVAALATLDVLENGGLGNAAEQGEYMLQQFAEMQVRHQSIGEVRGKGLMIGVEFVQDRESKAPDARIRNRVVELAFEHGLLIMGCGANSMRIIPPLTLSRAEADEGLQIFDYVLGLAEAELA